MAIRGWQISESTLAGLNNTGVYLFDTTSQETTLVNNYTPASTSMMFYEVNFITDEGSWLLGTTASSQAPSTWVNLGGVENLQVTGDEIPTQINGDQVVRPVKLFWWIPADTLAALETPSQSFDGNIVGTFPAFPPSDEVPSDDIQIERTDNGVILTVPPTNQTTTIQVSVGS